MFKPLIPVAEAFSTNFLLFDLKEAEDTELAGQNYRSAAFFQTSALDCALYLIDQLATYHSKLSLSTSKKVIIYLTPFAIALLLENKKIPASITKGLHFIHRHIVDAAQLLNVVSTIALYYLGHTAYAYSSIFFAGLSFALKRGWIPILHNLDQSSYYHITMICVGALVKNRIFIFFHSLDLISKAANSYFSYYTQNMNIPISTEGLIVNQEPKRINARHALEVFIKKLKFNRHFIDHPSLPNVPIEHVKMDDLIELYKKIDWKKELTDAKMRVLRDDRNFSNIANTFFLWKWIEELLIFFKLMDRTKEPSEKEKAISFLQHNLQELIKKVRDKKILAGKINNYEVVNNYLRRIIYQLNELEIKVRNKEVNNVELVDTLFILAKDGALCGAGLIRTLEEQDASLYALSAEETPTRMIEQAFHRRSKKEFQKMLTAILKKQPLTRFLLYLQGYNITDTHFINIYSQLFQRVFLLENESAKQDQVATQSPFLESLSKLLRIGSQQFMEHFFSPQAIIEFYQSEIARGAIPKNKITIAKNSFFYQWFLRSMKRDDIKLSIKQKFPGLSNRKLTEALLKHLSQQVPIENLTRKAKQLGETILLQAQERVKQQLIQDLNIIDMSEELTTNRLVDKICAKYTIKGLPRSYLKGLIEVAKQFNEELRKRIPLTEEDLALSKIFTAFQTKTADLNGNERAQLNDFLLAELVKKESNLLRDVLLELIPEQIQEQSILQFNNDLIEELVDNQIDEKMYEKMDPKKEYSRK